MRLNCNVFGSDLAFISKICELENKIKCINAQTPLRIAASIPVSTTSQIIVILRVIKVIIKIVNCISRRDINAV